MAGTCFDNFVLDLAAARVPQIWLGAQCPFDFHSVDLFSSTNFRVSSAHHQRYSVVWLYERLSRLNAGNYELVLDESIRLINGEGHLVIRCACQGSPTPATIKQYFAVRIRMECALVFDSAQGDECTLVFRVKRSTQDLYRNDSWTFAVVERTGDTAMVASFAESVRTLDALGNHEILIYSHCDHPTVCDGARRLDHRSDIGVSPLTVLASEARFANLLVAEAGLVLDRNFLRGFAGYGYDFDFVAIKRRRGDGSEIPTYGSLAALRRDEAAGFGPEDFSRLGDQNHYLADHLVIGKTETLRSFPCQQGGQDSGPSLCQKLRAASIPPRMNFMSSATFIGGNHTPPVVWVCDQNRPRESRTRLDMRWVRPDSWQYSRSGTCQFYATMPETESRDENRVPR